MKIAKEMKKIDENSKKIEQSLGWASEEKNPNEEDESQRQFFPSLKGNIKNQRISMLNEHALS